MNFIPTNDKKSGKLFIGNLSDLMSDDMMRNIDVIISVCDVNPKFRKYDRPHYVYPVHDSPDIESVQTMRDILSKCRPIIYFNCKQGKNVFIHCYAGISRSSTVLLDYLLTYYIFDTSKCLSNTECALKFVRQFRPIVNPNKGFYDLLLELHN